MPYKWSMSSQLTMKKGESGLGSWIYTALFSNKNINPKIKDNWKIDSSDISGNKSYDYLKHLVESFTREHDIVIDIYAGLGEMFQVAENNHRVCYGAESSPELCKQIIEKWEDLSKSKAIRVNL